MIRATLLLSGVFLAAPAIAADDPSGLDAYLRAVAGAEADIDAACAALPAPPDGRVWLRLGPEGIEIAPATPEAADAAAFWADAALGAGEAALALYGQATGAGLGDKPVMIEARAASGVTVHDGAAMHDGDPCDALRRMVGAIGGEASGGDPFAAARAAASGDGADGPRLTFAIGGEASAALAEPPPTDAIARGPDGVAARIETGEDGARVIAAATGDAEIGESLLRLYDPANPFVPIKEIPISVLPGAAPRPAGGGGVLSPGGGVEGVIAVGGANDVQVKMPEDGRLVFTSAAETDLVATLTDADGRVIARDDDSGDGYGFAFSADLSAGEYVLNLSHCCGGGGPFSVIAATE